MQVLILAASPRPDGNSRMLAAALAGGVTEAGHEAELVDLGHVTRGGFLRDCRTCRQPDGSCAIDDDYAELLTGRVLGADGLVYATPLYWYGMAAALKNFFDRMFCYISPGHPGSPDTLARLTGKRAALLLSSEERYPGAGLGVVAQLQEMSRYLGHEFIGVVQGVGNRRAEVARDPTDPLGAARQLGAGFFDRHHSDYRLWTERPNHVWPPARAAVYTGT
jgi:multimeric flavodoxin WrbA